MSLRSREHFFLTIFAFLAGLSAGSREAYAISSSSAFAAVPSRFKSEELTLGSRALGELCYSRGEMPDGTYCNPAYLGEAKDGGLLLRAFFGNGYAALSTADNFIFKPISRDFLQKLFQAQNITSVEANFGLTFTAPHFSASFEPYRVQYFSEIHNPNLPVVAVHAAIEKAFVFSGGTGLAELSPSLAQWSAGAKLSFLQRDFVHGSFSLFDVLAQEPRDLLPAQSQKVIWVEPTIAWKASTGVWKPRASATVTRLGFVSSRTALYPESTDLALGAGVDAEVGPGKLTSGLDFVDTFTASAFENHLRLGAGYQYGIINALAGWNADVVTLGTQLSFQVIQVGISYEFDRNTFSNADAGQRISTEFSIRF